MPETPSLLPCPNSPNCVSSQSSHPKQYIEPLRYTGHLEEAKERIFALIRSQPRTQIVVVKEQYIHIEITSPVFRFIDDVEFVFDDEQKLIHVRSASRTGYWDLGVNRKRVEAMRKLF